MERNHTIMQFFECDVASDGTHWIRLKEQAPELKKLGIAAVWIPPVTKATSVQDTGYSAYDVYDLGEFDQKGAVRTKYGTKNELIDAIDACHEQGIGVYVDLVMNHKAGADEKEVFKVIEVDLYNRNRDISAPFDIEGWTKFTYPGRKNKYSAFKWNFMHFNGTDYDAKSSRSGIFRIIGDNKKWNEKVDDEFGNYDYLMFANIDYNQSEVRQEMIRWGKWLVDTLNCDGYRLDAIKHINYDFIKEFSNEMIAYRGDNFYIVGEFWNSVVDHNQAFLDTINYAIDLFDVALHYKLHAASREGNKFDLRTIFDGTLMKTHPTQAVSFVDNHDSQPGKALDSWVQDWFKQSAYALILLRQEGYPCVFYGDYYCIGGDHPSEGKKNAIDPLLYARYHKAYGNQEDYFDHPNTIGWVRLGAPEIERSGCAVVISNGENGDKRMCVGIERADEVWVDLTGTYTKRITIGKDGWATFPVNGGSVSVWALPEFDVKE
ncbi:MAG: alpha-amylase [Gorillibacterium sp.]|nr:alpha-amylase [Gorillibacterium sp.]